MIEELRILIELQKVESEASRITLRKKELPLRMEELEKEFSALCAAVEGERQELEGLRKKRREKDQQLQAGQDMLKRTRERLFDVKTNKEYQSMLKEIETLEQKNSKTEDEIILLLDELERREKQMKEREKEFEGQRRNYEEQKAKISEELKGLDEQLGLCLQKGAELKKAISPPVLRKFEQVKTIGRGVAVVSVWKEVCNGCHMSIPPQLYNDLQKSTTIMTCPNCSRIIYWENRNSGT